MKKKRFFRGNERPGWMKLLLMMKLTIFLLFLSAMTMASGSYSQNTRFNLNVKDASIVQVLEEIERQTEFGFLFKTDQLDLDAQYNLDLESIDIETVMSKILDTDHYSYQIMDRIIVISKNGTENSQTDDQTPVKISGKVTDTGGQPLPGVTVMVKGTSQGTVTNANGEYSLTNIPEDATLVFSFVGMKSQEVSLDGKTNITISLEEASIGLEEIVAIGYGTQRRVNLTGAVEQVTSEVLDNRPLPNVTQGLQGAVPNLNISLTDGKPIRSAKFNIRGTTSIGQGGSALVLIDGVEGDPSMLNPNDIASVSVLKDAASAAIYGARGAFGVVLINTKKTDKQKTSVTYSGNFSIKSPTVVPDMVTDAYDYATRFVDAYSAYYDYARTPSKFHKAVKYSQDWYNNMANHRPGSGLPDVEINSNGEYEYYANTDWYDLLYKDHTLASEHNITVQGGSEKFDFMVSGRYYDQEGVFNYNSDDYKMYNMRAKGSGQICKWLVIANNMQFSQINYHNPLTIADGNVWYGLEGEAEPMSPMFNPDGTLTMAAAYSVGDLWYGKNGTDTEKRALLNTTSFNTIFLDNTLRINGDITYSNTDKVEERRRVQVPYSSIQGVTAYLGSSTNDFSKTTATTKYLATNIYAEYEKTWNMTHYLKAMAGYNYEQSVYDYLRTKRNGLIFEDATNLNLANGNGIEIASNYEKWRIAGGFFRFNYAFKDRYLLEVNGRLDGSTKFPTDQQWAFFPSVSAGWRISEEPFWKVDKKLLTDMKFRVSYGSLGNGNVASYAYRELFSISQMSHLINGILNQKTSSPSIIPDGLTWETVTMANIGLDFGSLNGRLRFSGDGYIRKTVDMFTVGPELPALFGASAPYGNYADMTTKGWELSISWRDKLTVSGSPLNYDIRFTMADHTSKIDKYNNPEKNLGNYKDARTNYYEGMTIGEIWGYETEGFFTSEEDIANHASQDLYFASNSGTWLPGDIKFKDLNNDEVIDYGTNKVKDPGDRKVIGNSTPRYTYSLNLGADWKGISVSAFFQGVGKQDWWPGADNALFWGQYNRPYNNIPKSMLNEIWSEENPNTYFPRYRGYVALQGTRELSVVQTRYTQNVAYVRLKNLQLGYSLPKNLIASADIQVARIYLSAENLWCWSPLYKHTKNFDVANIYGEDIEAKSAANDGGKNSIISNGGQTYNYPLLKSISLGLSLTF
uniref:SusC/RagA family TonB-linked outer membrane protein n=1 Tax=uncultured Draconibacterium sp. TaxID=1573823 RepID=UPI003217C286